MSGAVAQSGTVTRMETCPVHNIPFGQLFFPMPAGAGFWIGRCRDCEADEKRDQQANEFLLSQKNEIVREATKIIQQREHQAAIEKRTKRDLDAEMANLRKEREQLWKDYNTNLEWDKIACEIEDRKRTEFFEQLKGVKYGK